MYSGPYLDDDAWNEYWNREMENLAAEEAYRYFEEDRKLKEESKE